MALARRGRRNLVVDGREYSWKISIDSGYFVIVVEPLQEPRCRLEASTAFGRCHGDSRPITPAGVERLIRYAIELGWEPNSPAKPYALKDVDAYVELGPGRS